MTRLVRQLLARQAALGPGYWYLAGRYTSPEGRVMAARARTLTLAAAGLAAQGVVAVSPITEGHAVCLAAEELGLRVGRDAVSWEARNAGLIAGSWGVLVFKGPDWWKSVGVRREIGLARRMEKPVTLVGMEDCGLAPMPAAEWRKAA